jgi:hypothetical protein
MGLAEALALDKRIMSRALDVHVLSVVCFRLCNTTCLLKPGQRLLISLLSIALDEQDGVR